MSTKWDKFLQWEAASRDVIDFKKIYVDMSDDLISGLLLSQIVFWFLPNKEGKSKLRVFKHGWYWIAKGREEWWDEIRLSARQVDRALRILEQRGIIVTGIFRFNGAPRKHIRIDEDGFLKAWKVALQKRQEEKQQPAESPFSPNLRLWPAQPTENDTADPVQDPDFTQTSKSILPKRQNGFYPKGEMDFTQSVKSLTETTTETTRDHNRESEASSRTLAGSPGSPDRSPGEFNAGSPFSRFQKGDDYLSVASQCETTRQAAGGNYADTSEAGGADVLADHLITVYCQCMGEANPLGQELVACRAAINRVLKRKRLSNDGVVAERGLRVLLDPEGEWTFHFGNYALSGGDNRTKLFETHYGKVLARLLAGGDGYSEQHHKKGAQRGSHRKRSAKNDPNYRVATPEEAAPIVAAVKAREARLRGESG